MNQEKSRPKVVVLGGGTGTFTVLSGLKRHDVDLTAVVSIADDGGSTGRLRDELGVLPPGDIRQCLVALAEGDDALRNLLNYRFTKGELAGHNFGNIFLSALEMMYGSAESAIMMAHQILRVQGRVLPVSAQASRLFAELEDGTVVEGEHAIDAPQSKRAPIRECFLQPQVMANPEALQAIREADMVVLGPGDLYTSLVPVLLVQGVAEALDAATGELVYVLNLVSKPGQTDDYRASRFVERLKSYIAPARLNAVLVNSAIIPEPVLEKYTRAGEALVEDDLIAGDYLVLRVDILSERIARPVMGDKLARSLIRHDPGKLARELMKFMDEEYTSRINL
ncbi:MAG: gluconeogenesis factor YvcK family protein [Patescibacteria group bacterium]